MYNTISEDEYELRDDVTREITDTKHQYIFPYSKDEVNYAFDTLNRALSSLSGVAADTDKGEIQGSFVYAYRRFGRIFKKAYEYDFNRKKQKKLPTVKDIHQHFRHFEIEPRTFTIEKTEDELIITYEDGFHATDETITVEADEVSEYKKSAILNCGVGIHHEHAPSLPKITQRWRYGPSKVRFSIQQVDGVTKLGLENIPPEKPLWYKIHEFMSGYAGPYAYATFDLENQSSVIKGIYNRENDADI